MSDLQTGLSQRAELGNMLNKAGEWHYKRVSLADKLLKNKDWVESPNGGGGGTSQALDRLERDCFGDLCGNVGLCQLLDLLHNYPDENVWKQNKYDFKKMWANWNAKRKPEKRSSPVQPRQAQTRTPLPDPMVFEQETPAQKRKDYEKAVKSVSELERENERLLAENTRLKEENKQLKELLSQFKKLQAAV